MSQYIAMVIHMCWRTWPFHIGKSHRSTKPMSSGLQLCTLRCYAV